jgi:hypothetical protein
MSTGIFNAGLLNGADRIHFFSHGTRIHGTAEREEGDRTRTETVVNAFLNDIEIVRNVIIQIPQRSPPSLDQRNNT